MARLGRNELQRYKEHLRNLPPSGGGGCHPALLGCATLGVQAGVKPERICNDLRKHVHGTRLVTDREIGDAVKKAITARGQGHRPTTRHPRKRTPRGPVPLLDAQALLRKCMANTDGITEVDIWEASPVRIDTPPEQDSALLLEALYEREDALFLGGTYDRLITTAEGWRAAFKAGRALPPHIIPNPLTGEMGKTKDGRPSLRSDDCVKSFRFAVAEFDEMSREDQVRFWFGVQLPVCALIDSGGKSLHAWIRIDGIETADAWTEQVEQQLFRRFLIPLGCDAACRNEARLSRLPGHFREEKGRWQRLLYLAPEGRPIHGSA